MRTECLADALDNRVDFGVWGGMTERERRRLLRRNRTSPTGLPAAARRAGGRRRLTLPEALTHDNTDRWEYLTVPLLIHATKQILDNYGDGAELVQVPPNPENLVAYLKRPRVEG